MNEQELRSEFFAKTGRVATSEPVEYQAFLWGFTAAAASRDAEIAGLHHIIEEEAKDSALVIIERDQLRDLLRPFAALLQEHNRKGPDDQPIFQINDAAITLGDLRRALAATEPTSIPTDT